jgi:transcriptional regulator of arginine metabolism
VTKSYRHGQILKLIRHSGIFTQEELARALKETGIDATQVTLSRDIRELGVVKTAEGYRQLDGESPGMTFDALAGEFLQDVRLAQNQVVLKTAPGHASSVAVALDDAEWPEVVGTIAGDDTILVICQDSKTAETVRTKLIGLLEA